MPLAWQGKMVVLVVPLTHHGSWKGGGRPVGKVVSGRRWHLAPRLLYVLARSRSMSASEALNQRRRSTASLPSPNSDEDVWQRWPIDAQRHQCPAACPAHLHASRFIRPLPGHTRTPHHRQRRVHPAFRVLHLRDAHSPLRPERDRQV